MRHLSDLAGRKTDIARALHQEISTEPKRLKSALKSVLLVILQANVRLDFTPAPVGTFEGEQRCGSV